MTIGCLWVVAVDSFSAAGLETSALPKYRSDSDLAMHTAKWASPFHLWPSEREQKNTRDTDERATET